MSHKYTRTTCIVSGLLSIALMSCATPVDTGKTENSIIDGDSISATAFHNIINSASAQLRGEDSQKPIPSTSLREIDNLSKQAEIKTEVSVMRMFILESSLAYPELAIVNKLDSQRYGFFVFGADIDRKRGTFDWTVKAIVDLKNFAIVKADINESFGESPRTWNRASGFKLSNDFLRSASKADQALRPNSPLIRSFVMTGTTAEITGVSWKGAGKDLLINEQLEVFRIDQTKTNSSDLTALNSTAKTYVGRLE